MFYEIVTKAQTTNVKYIATYILALLCVCDKKINQTWIHENEFSSKRKIYIPLPFTKKQTVLSKTFILGLSLLKEKRKENYVSSSSLIHHFKTDTL